MSNRQIYISFYGVFLSVLSAVHITVTMNEMSVSTFANVCLQLNKDVVYASGTQHQVCENATKIIQRLKGLWFSIYTVHIICIPHVSI